MITIYSYTTLFYYILVQYVDRAKRQMSGMTVMEKVRPAARSFCGSCWSLGVVRNIAQLLSLSIREYCRPSHTTTSRNTGDSEEMVVSSLYRSASVRLLMLWGSSSGWREEQQVFLHRSTWDRSTQHWSDLDLHSTSSLQLSLEPVEIRTYFIT